MNIKSLSSGLLYRGEVEAKRQTYYVFEARRHFFVMSFARAKRGSGNFTTVDADAVDYVAKKFEGRKALTSTEVLNESRKPQHISSTLDALNALYILVAIRRAKIDSRFHNKRLFFNIKG